MTTNRYSSNYCLSFRIYYTVPDPELATYTKPLVGLIATPNGLLPTGIVAITEYPCALAVPISEENTVVVDIRNVIVKSGNNIREMVVFMGFYYSL